MFEPVCADDVTDLVRPTLLAVTVVAKHNRRSRPVSVSTRWAMVLARWRGAGGEEP